MLTEVNVGRAQPLGENVLTIDHPHSKDLTVWP